ncbi:MAG: C25 family cysteine peptidase [Reichenbachiella sp.]|uniref:putative type IX secretion system sortase PorU2 n=1 Tax=Reichenbachiella sp. TaxID=2184521 RepID=UPI002966F346|nr:C25 family cysteine peptidase [Reichenbachiella sp.]MDW3210161.1 C25 family cysteine peptidase [Reichenbachiella sp.]
MIRNRCYITLVFLCLLSTAMAQPYGNEWLNANQRYFKIKIGEDGIYRMTQPELAASGFPVTIVDPRRIQLYHQGQEIAIHVEGQIDGSFDSSDYLEFYAEKNDGTTDTKLYNSPTNQPHTYYNIFSDTATYFLTYKVNLVTGLRMSEFSENNTGGLPAENYHINETLLLKTDTYYEGQSYGSDNKIVLPTYDRGEGWTGSFASLGQNLDNTITGLSDQVQDDINPSIEVMLVGGNNNSHNVTILVGQNSGSLREISTATFDADENYLVSEEINWTDMAGGSMLVRATVNGVGGAADRVSVSYIKVDYSKGYDMSSASSSQFVMKTNGGNKSYIDVANAPSNIVLYDITSKSNPISIGTNEGAGTFNAIIDNTGIQRTLFAQSDLKAVTSFEEVSFNFFNPANYNYLMISHSDLRGNTTSGQGDQVTAYKNYRESVSGGGHTVLDIDIETIFNQFNYGNPSPIAIKNFCEYVYDNGTPEFLFLIGKASNVQANYYRQDPDLTTTRHFIPTYGYPGADVPFSTGFDGGSGYGVLATGRINATKPDHIEAYLNKVIEEEALPFNTLRQKNLVHLSGGNTESELNIFRSYIDGFANIADGELLGGESVQLSKNNNSAVEFINISDEINDGVMMVTFFGHSSGSITDIEIGEVSDPAFGYSNKGKYPVFMVNGCLAGDFFSENESFGVDWILTPNLGALSFMAHSHVAFSNNLRRYTNLFYSVAFTDDFFISQSVGEIKKETATRYINTYGASESSVSQVQLVNLQGDPAVKIFGPDKPDYDINEAYIKAETFDNSQLLATVDSFYLEMNIRNFGIYAEDTFDISVIRTFADGSTKIYGPVLYDQVLREDTIQFTINNEVSNASGLNSFTINLDPFNRIDEMDKTNNTASIDVFLSSGSTFNLFPSNLSVQIDPNQAFYFQSSNLLAGTRSFDIEIDTTATFDSQYLISQTLTTKVIGKLSVNLEEKGNIPNGKVFYWRTRFTDPLPTEGDEWTTSSFTLDRTLGEGWAQTNPVQFTEAISEGLELDPNTGLWSFQSPTLQLEVQNYGSDHPSFDYQDTEVLLNDRNYFITNSHADPGCRNNSINFLAFKRQSTVPFKPVSPPGFDELQPLICGVLPQVIFNYTSGDMSNASYGPEAFIDNLENDDKVLIFSLGTVDYSTWTGAFKDALETLGFDRTNLDALQDDEPVIMYGAKNLAAGTARIDTSGVMPKNAQQIFLKETINGSYDTGEISSGLIGPALSWSQLTADIQDSGNPGDDTKVLSVYGVRQDRTEQLLVESPTVNDIDMSTIDATVYPFARVQLEISDPVLQTPQQLRSWRVDYETAPEGLLLLNSQEGTTSPVELQEGQPYNGSYTFWNFSTKDFSDSIKVNYELINVSTSISHADSMNLAPLSSGDSTQFDFDFVTMGNLGLNDMILNTNKNYPNEVYTFNNSARFSNYLMIEPDETNPLVDVSFDGVQIMDGDIVSPTPSIEIILNDENSYLLKEDTTGINIYLKHPCETCDFERIAFSSTTMDWSPATADEDFKSTFTPERLEDGIYSLRVLANDASGNPSGLKPYEINFEVINASTITNFYPYPNPFSSSTRFVFTLTGSEFPEDIKIQILTVSGRVVKEIFMDELGPINIGNNKTEYAWDGHDNYGDQLANGVYLYRVLIKNPGENFKHRETSADRGFKNGFGKMYLLR